MPTPTKYTFSISGSFPNHIVATDRLTLEIGQSSIITALSFIATSGDNCDIWFKDVLSGGDQTTLNAVVAAHSGQPLSGQAVTSSITGSGQNVAFTPVGSANVGIQITGTWVATLVFEGTIDGSNWFSIPVVTVGDIATSASTTINGQWRVPSSGFNQIRVRSSLYTSGSASITFQATGSGAAVVRDASGQAAVVSGYTNTANSNRVPITATTYTEQLTNAQRSVSSSSASDTSAGTGARTIRICYFDQTMAGPFYEDVTLNGTTPVNTVSTTICFIENIRVLSVGSGGNNAGTITLFAATAGGGGAIGTIAVNDNQTNWCHHYVASGATCFLVQTICGNDGASSGNLTVLKTSPSVANTPDFVVTPQLRIKAGEGKEISFPSPIPIVGPGRLLLQIKPDAGAGSINWYAGFGYKEVS